MMRGAAYGSYTDAPYQPVIRALRPTLAALSDDDLGHVLGTATDELIRLIPELADRVDGLSGRATRPHGRSRAAPAASARGGA